MSDNTIHGKNVLLGLSGGINSAAILPWLVESDIQPKTLHLYYAHFKEHSPDTAHFVMDCIRYARLNFGDVRVTITRNSIMDYFRKRKMIPHPMVSLCSRELKREPIEKYSFDNGIGVDLVGYVKHEIKRRTAKIPSGGTMFEAAKVYPIGAFTDEWCFEIVKRTIGWYPAIYDIRDKNGKRVFKHNNCLPCKNGDTSDMEEVKEYYPREFAEAMKLSAELGKYWGRDEAEFYTTWGRELGQDSTCEVCKF